MSVRCTHAGTLCALERHTLRAVLVGEAERRDDAACRALRRALAPLGEPEPAAEPAAGTEAGTGADAEAGGGSEAGSEAKAGGGGGVSPFSPSLSREVAAIIEAAQPVHLPPHAPLPPGIYLVCRLGFG